MRIKTSRISEEYWFCTNCNIEIEEAAEGGAPIGGLYYICPHCKRQDNDCYKDNKGLTHRERDIKYQTWLLVDEIQGKPLEYHWS